MSEALAFVDPAGVTTDLSDHVDFETLWGVSGRGMPKYEFVEDEAPGVDAAITRDVLVRPREVSVPVFVSNDDPAALRTLLRTFARRLNPTRGAGTLLSTGPDGIVRELTCRYGGGLTLDGRGPADGAPRHQRAELIFRAADDPYWRDAADVVQAIPSGSAGRTFFPFFPLRLTSSEVWAELMIDNTGDVRSWPVWTITGPADGVALRNLTTGKALVLARALEVGEILTVDTRSGAKAVRNHEGENLYGSLTSHDLWPLMDGENDVRVELGAVADDTAVEVAYRRRYLIA